MGGATFAIGLLPTYAQAGPIAPVLLILMRIIQGTALGGEYGGAAIYVAEHAPSTKRGAMTGWIQTSASFGLGGALLVILIAQNQMGKEAFEDAGWTGGWRIPFLLSACLLAISIFMRLKLTESPAFAALKAAGTQTRAPYREAFGQRKNLKIVLLALVAIMSAQGASWYTTFFYADQVFLQRFLRLDFLTGTRLLMLITLASAPLYVFFAWLSDRVGRKWVMWAGMTVALVAFFPAFHAFVPLANPALAEAQARTPVVVIADPQSCSVQFDIIGKARFVSSCDIAKSALSNAGVSYSNRPGPAGAPAEVKIGETTVVSRDAQGLSSAAAKQTAGEVKAHMMAALKAAGYPDKADPARVNFWGLFGVLMVFVVAATALYGPMAAALVELFPTRICYTALSLPYHIGTGWIGGFRHRHRRHLRGALLPGDLHRYQRRHPAVPAQGNGRQAAGLGQLAPAGDSPGDHVRQQDRRDRDHGRHRAQDKGSAFRARNLGRLVDRRGQGQGLAGNGGHEGDGRPELAQGLGEA